MSQPRQLDTALYRLLRSDDVKGFNAQKPKEGEVDLRGGDFRGIDLRGLDLRSAKLEGASLAHAQISGSYFPVELSADEILMSVNFGTRLRYNTRL